jgi:NAD(P)-dependent dehydrogenase (short-subunit alcohol dehydrogenase family)
MVVFARTTSGMVFQKVLNSMIRRAWLVTGTSQGFGLATVKELLHQGFQVGAATRSIPSLKKSLGSDSTHPNLLPLQVDLSDDDSVQASVNDTIKKFGQLDVLMTNAGFGVIGAIEEFTRNDLRRLFEVNFIGAHAFWRTVLPHFRQRRNGHILNISSIAAYHARRNWGLYASSKAALTAMADALSDEVGRFGINVTSVMPGPFKSNFRNVVDETTNKIPDYSHSKDAKRRMMRAVEPGNVEKAAKLFIKLAQTPNPPKWIFLGEQAVKRAENKNKLVAKEIADWKVEAVATDGD